MNTRETIDSPTSPNTVEIPLESIKAWFFDLDGTLMDTDDQTVDSLTQRLLFLGNPFAKRLARFLIMKSETPLNFAVTLVDMLGSGYFSV